MATVEIIDYDVKDNQNLNLAIKYIISFFLVFGLIISIIFLFQDNTEAKKYEKVETVKIISTISDEIKLIREILPKVTLKEISSTTKELKINLQNITNEKVFLPLLIRYENYISIKYLSNGNILIRINKLVFKKEDKNE